MASLSNINGIFDVHSTGAIQFNGNHGTAGQILKSNGNAAPTWVAASTVIGGPYLPLTGGTLTGATATAAGISFTVGGTLTGTSATFSGDVTAATFNTLPIETARNNNANRIVRTNVHGYVDFGWINTTSGATTSTIDRIYASNDGYIRYVTPATFRIQVTDPYYAPAGTVSGVTSVATGNGITGGTITTTGTVSLTGTYTGRWNGTTGYYIKDTRASDITPADSTDHAMNLGFTNQVPGNANWQSYIQMKGWHDGYTSWQIIGPSTTTAYDNWYLRSGLGTTWNTAREIWHTGNFTPSNYLPLAGGIMSGNIGRSAYNSGYQVGGYNNIGASHAKTNPIHVLGTSYEPTATGLSNMYGIGYTRGDASFLSLAQGTGWGLYVASDGDARIFLDGSEGDIYATNKLCVNSYANQAGGLLFSAGQTTGTTRSLNLRTTSVTSDPSSSDGSNSTGITWGQRTDNNPYYIIKPTQLNFGGGNYSKLTLNWHTGIRIGGSKSYGGTKFYNDAPDIVGEGGVIMNVGVGNDNIGIVNALTVGGTVTVGGISNLGNAAPSRVLMSDSTDIKYNDLATARAQFNLSYDTFRRITQTSDTNYWTGVKGWSNQSLNTTIPNMGSGFFDVWSSPTGQPSTEASHWLGSQVFHYTRRSDSGNIYGYQTAMGAANPAIMYVRGIWGGSSWGSWYRMHNDATALIKINNQISISTDNSSNLKIQASASSTDAGITGYAGNGTHVFQLYGAGNDYGFLNGNWAAWDLRKVKNGNLYMNNSTTYYLDTTSTSYMNAVTLVGTFSGQNGYFNQDLAVGFNSGAIGGKVNIQINSANGIGIKNNLNGVSNPTGLLSYTSASMNAGGYHMVFQAAPTSGSDTNMLLCNLNGNLRNRNNSYGQYSDETIKENITDATPKLEDVKKLKVKNFNFIGDDLKQIGLIAQETEKVFPGLVEDDLNPQGDRIKSLKYSVLVPILVKAIQELEARVKELENK